MSGRILGNYHLIASDNWVVRCGKRMQKAFIGYSLASGTRIFQQVHQLPASVVILRHFNLVLPMTIFVMVHWLTALLLYAKKENMNSPIKRGDPVIIIEGAPEWMSIETAPNKQVIEELEQLKAKLADQTKAADHWMEESCKNHNDLVRANEKLAEFLAQKPVAWLYEVNGRIKLETKRLDNYYWMGEGWVKGKPLILAAGSVPANEWKDAVLNTLADHGMDAPLTDTPREIVKKLTDMVATMARDPAINAGAAPAAKVPEWMPLPSAPKGNL